MNLPEKLIKRIMDFITHRKSGTIGINFNEGKIESLKVKEYERLGTKIKPK